MGEISYVLLFDAQGSSMSQKLKKTNKVGFASVPEIVSMPEVPAVPELQVCSLSVGVCHFQESSLFLTTECTQQSAARNRCDSTRHPLAALGLLRSNHWTTSSPLKPLGTDYRLHATLCCAALASVESLLTAS